MFTAEFFTGNRRRLRERLGDLDLIVLTAHGQMQRNNDMAFPFRQDSNFWYLTGITEPDVILVMHRDQEYLIVPSRDIVRVAFDGGVVAKNLVDRSGIPTVLDAKRGWQKLTAQLKQANQAGIMEAPPGFVEFYDFYTNPSRATLMARLKEHNPDLTTVDLREHFAQMRMIKQQPELAALKASINLTVKSFQRLRRQLTRMRYEYEAEAFLTHQFRRAGAKTGYDMIVGSGINGCTLHYEANQDPLSPDNLVLIDAGAEVEYYSADITRTYSLREPTKRQRAVHQAVVDAQDYAYEQLKPGISIRDNEKNIEQFIGQKLQELGLIKSLDRAEIRKYYPHALSHYLGLDVHDLGDYDVPLQSGMVLTVEPGIYIPEEGIGVRIEDNILVTKTGIKILSNKLSRDCF